MISGIPLFWPLEPDCEILMLMSSFWPLYYLFQDDCRP